MIAIISAVGPTCISVPAQHNPDSHMRSTLTASQRLADRDSRILVAFPPALARHTLANMRNHLLALQEITKALASEQTDAAAKIAESRLGMSSLHSHGAHDVAKHMPQAMQHIGTVMHRAASRFAIEAKTSGVTGNSTALSALGEILSACNACQSAYRLK